MFQRAPSIKDQLLSPKNNGLKGPKKPRVLIIRMAHDEDRKDNATAFNPTKKLAEDRGFSVTNTKEIIFHEDTGELLEKDKKGNLCPTKENKIVSAAFANPKKPVVIWLEAHGAPSWLFGHEGNFESEEKGTLLFRDCLNRIAEENNVVIGDIIINACYSGTEVYNQHNHAYTNSPARLLSVVMPDNHILGFIGVTSSAKVRGFVDEKMKPLIMPLSDASILFKNGLAIDYKTQNIFCNPEYVHMKPFVMQSCGIPENSEQHYRICPAREFIKKNSNGKPPVICFGDQQYEMLVTKASASAVPTKHATTSVPGKA